MLSPTRRVAAAALANARNFGGGDYGGFHNFMALMPSYQMSCELPEARRPLPVLKVLYRNSMGGHNNEVLKPVVPATLPKDRSGGEVLREATRAHDVDRAERDRPRQGAGSGLWDLLA